MLHARQERELASRILAALSCTEADDEDSGKKEQLDLPHLLGIVQMRGNLPAQKAAAEQVAQEVGGFGGARYIPSTTILSCFRRVGVEMSPLTTVSAKVEHTTRVDVCCCP